MMSRLVSAGIPGLPVRRQDIESLFLADYIYIDHYSDFRCCPRIPQWICGRTGRTRCPDFSPGIPDHHQRTGQRIRRKWNQHKSTGNCPSNRNRCTLFAVPHYIRIAQIVCRTPRDQVRRRGTRPHCRGCKGLHATICSGLYCQNLA